MEKFSAEEVEALSRIAAREIEREREAEKRVADAQARAKKEQEEREREERSRRELAKYFNSPEYQHNRLLNQHGVCMCTNCVETRQSESVTWRG